MAIYPITSKENSRRLKRAIRHVFLTVWDPIGVSDAPNAQDEYDSYLAGMLELLMTNASDKQLNQYLVDVVGYMGMDGSRITHRDVIQALRAIDLHEEQRIANN
jgi:hypothetical protein